MSTPSMSRYTIGAYFSLYLKNQRKTEFERLQVIEYQLKKRLMDFNHFTQRIIYISSGTCDFLRIRNCNMRNITQFFPSKPRVKNPTQEI